MSRYFSISDGVLVYRRGYETVRIEGWGENALRVRTTQNRGFISENWALTEEAANEARTAIEVRPLPNGNTESIAVIRNGGISAEMTEHGRIRFLKIPLSLRGESLDHRRMVEGRGRVAGKFRLP